MLELMAQFEKDTSAYTKDSDKATVGAGARPS
jgi:hypothetical protein